jgi:hypothetical protein
MLKYSVAVVALLAGTSLACAQQQDHGSNNSGAGMSNSASEHAPGQMKDNGSAKESGSAKDLAPGQNKGDGNSAKDLAPGRVKDGSASKSDDKSNEHRSQNETDRSGKDADRNAKNTSDHAKDSDHNAKNDADRNNKNFDHKSKNEGSSDRNGKNESRNEHSRSSTGASEGSEGRPEHRGSVANVTTEQKTRIRTVFSRHHVEPARNLNVSVNVGVRLPHSVHLYPVPEDIVLIVPDYRGYEYIMLDDNRVAIVDPDTFEVVDIIEIA